MHCYFVLAGDSETAVIYAVERVRDGRSFCTRTVQARQRGRCIFTTTLSFMREGSGGRDSAAHEARMPDGVIPQLERMLRGRALSDEERESEARNGADTLGPFESRRLPIANGEALFLEEGAPFVI